MSIGKRLVRLVRSNLNALLERGDGWERSSSSSSARIEELSDDELEREIVRRRTRREAAQEAADRAGSGAVDDQAWREVEDAVRPGAERFRTAGRAARPGRRTVPPASSRTGSGRDPRLARLYAQLECPYGADADTLRKHYRALMRRYHPDMHSGSAEKQRLATELSQKLTAAYNELRRGLGR